MFHLLSKQRNKMSALAFTNVTATITAFFSKRIFGFHSYCFRNWVPISLGGTDHYCDCGIAKCHVSVFFGLHESKNPIWFCPSCSEPFSAVLRNACKNIIPIYTCIRCNLSLYLKYTLWFPLHEKMLLYFF